jgi:drug/metabolite transporter (DMT)-like permease
MQSEWCRKLTGYISLGVIIISWVSQAEFSEYLEKNGSGSEFNHPFYIVWMNHSCMSFFFILAALKVKCLGTQGEGTARNTSIRVYLQASGLSMKTYVQSALALGFLYLIPNYLWFLCLGMDVSVGIVTAIFNTSAAAAYIFSAVFLKEQLDWKKNIGVGFSVLGAFLSSKATNAADMFNPAALWTLLAATLYGLWEVLYKKYAVKNTTTPLLLMFILGSYGLVHLFVFWVFMIPLNFLHIEPFAFPSIDQFRLLAFNAFLGTAYNISFMAALAFLPSPVFVSVATLMTIPLSSVTDFLFHHTELVPIQVIGIILIVIGFLIFLVDDLHADGNHTDANNEPNKAAYTVLTEDIKDSSYDMTT